MPRYLLTFLLLLCGYSTWDWYEHVSRPDSTFAEHPVAWGAFTAGSIAVIVAIVVIGHVVVRRWRGSAGFAVHAGLVAIAFVTHVLATGPLLDALLWPPDRLIFKPVAAVVFAAIAVAALGALRLLLPPPRTET
ncbi:MAG: hypothetical protein ACYTJ0_14460 [Planctomycetota bacterium]|jgi:hypothetical protein